MKGYLEMTSLFILPQKCFVGMILKMMLRLIMVFLHDESSNENEFLLSIPEYFPGGPVVKILCSQCTGPEFNP